MVSQEYKEKLLNKLPVFYEKSLVHIVPWRPLVEYQYILKQECPVWVEVECICGMANVTINNGKFGKDLGAS